MRSVDRGARAWEGSEVSEDEKSGEREVDLPTLRARIAAVMEEQAVPGVVAPMTLAEAEAAIDRMQRRGWGGEVDGE